VRQSRRLQVPVLHVAVDDLLGDALGEIDRQFVRIDCRYGAVTEHRMRDVIANRVLARIGRGRRRGFESGSARRAGLCWFLRFDHREEMGTNTALFKRAVLSVSRALFPSDARARRLRRSSMPICFVVPRSSSGFVTRCLPLLPTI